MRVDPVTPGDACVANIGERGAVRRRRGGYVWAAISVVLLAAALAMHAPHTTLFGLAIPIGLAALGFLQAREKT